MKTRICLLLLVAAVAGATGYAVAHRVACRPAQSGLDRLRDVSRLARALDLRPEQVEALKSLQGRLCSHLATCCARHCACRKELAAALIAEPFDATRVQELRESLGRCYAESEMLALEHIRNLRSILDGSQRMRLDRMIAKALSGPCGLCSNCVAGCEEEQGANR